MCRVSVVRARREACLLLLHTPRSSISTSSVPCVIAVFKSVYFTRIHTGSLRVYTRWLPPRSPPLPGGGRAGAWATGELVTRQSPQYSLHAPPGGSRPRYSRNVVFPVLFKSCYYQYIQNEHASQTPTSQRMTRLRTHANTTEQT